MRSKPKQLPSALALTAARPPLERTERLRQAQRRAGNLPHQLDIPTARFGVERLEIATRPFRSGRPRPTLTLTPASSPSPRPSTSSGLDGIGDTTHDLTPPHATDCKDGRRERGEAQARGCLVKRPDVWAQVQVPSVGNSRTRTVQVVGGEENAKLSVFHRRHSQTHRDAASTENIREVWPLPANYEDLTRFENYWAGGPRGGLSIRSFLSRRHNKRRTPALSGINQRARSQCPKARRTTEYRNSRRIYHTDTPFAREPLSLSLSSFFRRPYVVDRSRGRVRWEPSSWLPRCESASVLARVLVRVSRPSVEGRWHAACGRLLV